MPADYPAIAELTVSVYVTDGLAHGEYVATLADVERRAAETELYVVGDGTLLGSVAFAPHGSSYAEITRDPSEAAFRMLAVDPAARGRGVGRALVQACMDRARELGATRMVISTENRMDAARQLYAGLGFRPLPERDWSPVPDVQLRCFVLEL